jgi:hypothetical protein
LSAEAPRPLPWLLRTSTWLCLVLAGLVSLMATQELVLLFNFPAEPPPNVGPQLDPAVVERMWRVQRQSLEGMATVRGLVLAGLVLTTGMSLVGAARLLFPAGLPREPIRRLLAGTALLSGVLRVIDGAQAAVVARRVGVTLAEGLNAANVPGADAAAVELARKIGPLFVTGGSILLTAAVAGVFVVYGQYLASERVRKLFAEEPSTEHTGT